VLNCEGGRSWENWPASTQKCRDFSGRLSIANHTVPAQQVDLLNEGPSH
jgi:hypothetical protein